MQTSFTREVMARFDDDPFEAVAWMDRAHATDYATFAPLVMRHADDGDPVARAAIVRDAAEKIDDLVRELIERGAPARRAAWRPRHPDRAVAGARRAAPAAFRSRAMRSTARCIWRAVQQTAR